MAIEKVILDTVLKVGTEIGKEVGGKAVESLKNGANLKEVIAEAKDVLKESTLNSLEKLFSPEQTENFNELKEQTDNLQDKIEQAPDKVSQNQDLYVQESNNLVKEANQLSDEVKNNISNEGIIPNEIKDGLNEFKEVLDQLKEIQDKLKDLGISPDLLSILNTEAGDIFEEEQLTEEADE